MRKLLALSILSLCFLISYSSGNLEASSRCSEVIKDFVNPVHFVNRHFDSEPGYLGRLFRFLTPPRARPLHDSFRSTRAFRIWLYIDWTLSKAALAGVGIYVGASYHSANTLAQEVKAAEQLDSYLEEWNTSVENSVEILRKAE